MNQALECLKVELETFGENYDAKMAERDRRMFNITRDTGEFLAVLVRATVAKKVLEIGTSNGYSTLWLAEATQAIGGSVTTVELAQNKADLARANFERSGLSCITLMQMDATLLLEQSTTSGYDLVFLDSERSEYAHWWPQLRRVLRPGGLAGRGQRHLARSRIGSADGCCEVRSRVHDLPRSHRQRGVSCGKVDVVDPMDVAWGSCPKFSLKCRHRRLFFVC